MIAAACCALLLLAVHNVVIERLAGWMYVPSCITVAAGLVGMGRRPVSAPPTWA